MALDQKFVGRTYPPTPPYLVSREKIAEFATATVAIWLAFRRTRGEQRVVARLSHALVIVMVVAYPLLGVAYLGDRLGSLIEPVFFVTFSAIVLIEVFEPSGPRPAPGQRQIPMTGGWGWPSASHMARYTSRIIPASMTIST